MSCELDAAPWPISLTNSLKTVSDHPLPTAPYHWDDRINDTEAVHSLSASRCHSSCWLVDVPDKLTR